MRRVIKRSMATLAVLGLAAAGTAWYFFRGEAQAFSFTTTEIRRGDLILTISATGTIEPEEVIDVGAQVAGQILSFGKDADGKTVDYGSHVREGTVLARIDDSLYANDEAQAVAQLQSAQAGLLRAQADLEQANAQFQAADRDWTRARKLGPSEALAQSSYDSYRSAYEVAQANVAVAEAGIVQSKAAVAQAQAARQRAERNMAYCTIVSPVKGVIIDRRVNTGQTVVSSLNAPSLFLIARDLKRMEVWVAVNEADITKIHAGQPVAFTVDAFPEDTFDGSVRKIRLNASMTQNVVTYTVEITIDNSSGRLLPYLTANVRFEVNRRNNVLLVPNAALEFEPAAAEIAPEYRGETAAPPGTRTESAAGKTGNAGRKTKEGSRNGAEGIVWVPDGQYVRPVRVRTGLSDGTFTEIEGKNLEGLKAVTALAVQSQQDGSSENPFMPQFRRRGKSK